MVLVIVAFGAAGFVAYRAFERQSERVDEVAAANTVIEQEHAAIGSEFQNLGEEVTEATKEAEAALATVAGRGPVQAAILTEFDRRGFLVPRPLPRPLRRVHASVGGDAAGYSITWRNGVALFADRTRSLRHWTAQVRPRNRDNVRIGPRAVVQLRGAGVVYAWRAGARTYAVTAPPRFDRLARALVASLR